MINLCIPVGYNYEGFTIDDVEWIVNSKEEFIIPYVAMKENYPLPRLSIQLCEWYEYIDDTYICIDMLINLDDIDDFSLRVNEGTYCNTNQKIIATDGFLDIKTDAVSIQQAVNDIKYKRIPLYNRVETINFDEYPYVIQYDE